MLRTALSLDGFVEEINRRMRHHPDYRDGMLARLDPLTAPLGGIGGYTFEWPGTAENTQAWFDTRNVIFDVELEMRERYLLETD